MLAQQQQQQHYDVSAASQVQLPLATNLPSWARDDDDRDEHNFRDENQPPHQSGSSSFNFGGGGGRSASNGHPRTGTEDHKKEVSAESWAEMYRKQRASRRKWGAK